MKIILLTDNVCCEDVVYQAKILSFFLVNENIDNFFLKSESLFLQFVSQ
jgi:hypothetical protein